ncbi:hypothetical protein [Tunicatimonas pelagia]|uniref:hypothetical protein n=1 Tax=Tunicatimonas pelagia TaxID=931531 RepID=UPI0026661F5D|nr:hypothetical protein [Tunicatimonas pelagia]WKN45378.1 hypothetical protein P0M28_10460 [Tunicatimonas pelagia]
MDTSHSAIKNRGITTYRKKCRETLQLLMPIYDWLYTTVIKSPETIQENRLSYLKDRGQKFIDSFHTLSDNSISQLSELECDMDREPVTILQWDGETEDDLKKQLQGAIEEAHQSGSNRIDFVASVKPVFKSPRLFDTLMDSGVHFDALNEEDTVYAISTYLYERIANLTAIKKASKKYADRYALNMADIVKNAEEEIFNEGQKVTNQRVADKLTEQGIAPPRGKPDKAWRSSTVHRLRQRIEKLKPD